MTADGELVCIIPGPTELLVTQDAGVRWCFGCRKHLPHTDELWGDPPGSYYEPVWLRRCSRCHQDRTCFPGRESL